MKKIFVMLLVVIAMSIMSFPIPSEPLDSHEWEVFLGAEIVHPDGGGDYVYFCESSLADDDVDIYDMPKPPMGPPDTPYMYIYREDLPTPYYNLLKEYRHYPGEGQIWELRLFYTTALCPDVNRILISWSKNYIIQNLQYDHVYIIYKDVYGVRAVNMKEYNKFTFIAEKTLMYYFTIFCEYA
jgi:hypothetical protein